MDALYIKNKITKMENAIVVEDKNNPPQFILDEYDVSLTPFLPNPIPFEESKTLKSKEILDAFNNTVATGHFLSTVLSIEVDCRRDTTKNDLQNVQGLISYMTRNEVTEVEYIGYTSTGIATISQLQTLCNEMEDHVLGLYQKKWALEAQIKEATTIEQLNAIVW